MRVLIPNQATTWRTAVRYCFLAVAIACLGLYGYAYLERVLYQTWESREFDRAAHRNRPVGVAASDDQTRPIGRKARRFLSPSRPSPTELIGRLSIPGLHLSVMVREGIGPDTLQLAVGHIPGTALPGQEGNVGLAGHRDTFFRGLRTLRTGDKIRFSTVGADFSYVVESILVVGPDNVAVLAPSSANMLTLVTCYPFSYIGSAPKRFVVRARQASPQTLAAVE